MSARVLCDPSNIIYAPHGSRINFRIFHNPTTTDTLLQSHTIQSLMSNVKEKQNLKINVRARICGVNDQFLLYCVTWVFSQILLFLWYHTFIRIRIQRMHLFAHNKCTVRVLGWSGPWKYIDNIVTFGFSKKWNIETQKYLDLHAKTWHNGSSDYHIRATNFFFKSVFKYIAV